MHKDIDKYTVDKERPDQPENFEYQKLEAHTKRDYHLQGKTLKINA